MKANKNIIHVGIARDPKTHEYVISEEEVGCYRIVGRYASLADAERDLVHVKGMERYSHLVKGEEGRVYQPNLINRVSVDYDTLLGAVKLLADAATDAMLGDYEETDGFTGEATAICLRLIDALFYQDIVSMDGPLTDHALMVASLEGWAMHEPVDEEDRRAIIAYDHDPTERFSNAEALAFVRERAESGEPGTKLHMIAIELHQEPGEKR
jgi:hypothetical protein